MDCGHYDPSVVTWLLSSDKINASAFKYTALLRGDSNLNMSLFKVAKASGKM